MNAAVMNTARVQTAPGPVALVGAGPGDPELITVRGMRLLQRAEVVVYDRLVHPDLLDLAPPAAEMIFVGKASGLHVVAQRDIEGLLIDRAHRGLRVVRLKGGDPFVFGRGGEEAAALTAAGVPWQVVPAVTSAIGAPAAAGIPVTHRGTATSFAVVTAHGASDDAGEDRIDWYALAGIDTVVVLMGVAALPTVAREMVAAGRDPSTPVAVVERGTLVDQRVTTGNLETIAARARAIGVRAPATIVIGHVVDLHATLAATQDPNATAPDWRAWTRPKAEFPVPIEAAPSTARSDFGRACNSTTVIGAAERREHGAQHGRGPTEGSSSTARSDVGRARTSTTVIGAADRREHGAQHGRRPTEGSSSTARSDVGRARTSTPVAGAADRREHGAQHGRRPTEGSSSTARSDVGRAKPQEVPAHA